MFLVQKLSGNFIPFYLLIKAIIVCYYDIRIKRIHNIIVIDGILI